MLSAFSMRTVKISVKNHFNIFIVSWLLACLTIRVRNSWRRKRVCSYRSLYIWQTGRRPRDILWCSFGTLQEDRWRFVWCWPPCCRGDSCRRQSSDCHPWRRLCTPALRHWLSEDKPPGTRTRQASQNTQCKSHCQWGTTLLTSWKR